MPAAPAPDTAGGPGGGRPSAGAPRRPFDYLVPASMDEQAVPGCRVKVRFAGRDVDGFVLGREDRTRPRRPALDPCAASCPPSRSCRRRCWLPRGWSPTVTRAPLADVLRLAVPARHARVEAARRRVPGATARRPRLRASHGLGGRGRRAGLGRASRRRPSTRVRSGPRPPGPAGPSGSRQRRGDPQGGAGQSAAGARQPRRRPSRPARSRTLLGPGSHVVLTADLGPAARYRAFLAVARGGVDIVVGTRAAAFAPVRRLGLVAIWDDGDDLYAEPRSPYPHAREVLVLRAYHERAAMLLGSAQPVRRGAGPARGRVGRRAERADATRSGRPRPRCTSRGRPTTTWPATPRPGPPGCPPRSSRRSGRRWRAARCWCTRRAYGYQPALACSRCRRPAPLRGGAPDRWAGRWAAPPRSAAGVGRRPRHGRARTAAGTDCARRWWGLVRTAEEWGRAFPQDLGRRVRR